jgi:4-amino-4-deoxy-L-arabinose transferase-like glycosyltransferase
VTRRQRLALGGVLALALALRVAWCVVAAREPAGLHDPGFYRALAAQLADGDGYVLAGEPTAYYPVGYPAVLAALFLVTDAHTTAVAALNVAAGVGAVALAFALGRRIAGPTAGIAAAAVLATVPNLVLHTAVALSETVFVAAFLGALVLLLDRRLLLAGLVLGASILVRPVAVPVLPLLVLPWLAAGDGRRAALRQTAVVALAAIAVVVPWTVRNAIRMDAFVPISTNTGDNLCMSRQPGAHGGFLLTDHCFGGPAVEGLDRPEYEIARDRQGRELAFEFVRDRPARELRLWLDRLGAAVRHDHDALDAAESYGDGAFLTDGERDALRRLADGHWYVLGPLGLGAAVAVAAHPRLRRDEGLVLLVTSAVGLLLPIVLFFGDPRFKVPAVAVLAVLVPCAAIRWAQLARPGVTGAERPVPDGAEADEEETSSWYSSSTFTAHTSWSAP